MTTFADGSNKYTDGGGLARVAWELSVHSTSSSYEEQEDEYCIIGCNPYSKEREE